MNELKLPDQLKGSWHNALILTYGMDIPFFESALLSEFSARCRNKIILADGRHYLKASANYAQSGLVRHMNQRYVAAGIFSPNAAHAKLILLTNPEQGRLLVGSGNLGLQGYASPGELFAQYEYGEEQTETFPAFLSSVDLIKGLINLGYVSETVSRHFDRLLESTPWLYQAVESNWQPVRHNLERPFLDQLAEAVGNEPVEELVILSPFYDPAARALAKMLTRLQPQQTTLLVQPGSTSVNPQELANVITAAPNPCQVQAFTHSEDHTLYYHAKLYLLKLKDRAICLQGSPNLSQVAMLRTVPSGNIELANLLLGSRNSFDYLFDPLQIEPATTNIAALDLSYHSDIEQDSDRETWQLQSGEWHGDKLTITYQGELPDLSGVLLNIAGELFSCNLVRNEAKQLLFALTAETIACLKYAAPLVLQWGDAEDAINSNPIFVCNRAGLDATMEAEAGDETIERTGGLDLDDEELEQLVGELESHMVIDRQSVWQVAGRKAPTTTQDDDEALRLDYAGIDYNMLRQHPKLRQYTMTGHSAHAQTRLQVILSSITDHFQGLIDVATGVKNPAAATIDSITDAETEEEIEQEAEEKQRRQRSREQRLRQIFKHFIRRYLWGIRSSDFQELAGHEMITHNYIIFAHLLWALFRKEWFASEYQFIIKSLLTTWRFFWGDDEKVGYLQQQANDVQIEMLQFIRDYHAESQLIASLYHASKLTQRNPGIRLELRDFWRYLLHKRPFPIDNQVLEENWIYVADLYRFEPPRPSAIAKALKTLARFETEANFLASIEKRYGMASGICYFERVIARRTINYRQRDVKVKCLNVPDADNVLLQETAVSILQAWMAFESLDYYRISFKTSESSYKLLFYETADQSGVYWDEAKRVDEDIYRIKHIQFHWETAFSELQVVANKLDATLIIPQFAQMLAVE